MEIIWFGQACFRLKGKNGTVIIDPYDPQMVGLKLPRELLADVVLSTHSHADHNNTSIVEGTSSRPIMTFTEPGEYEISGVVITGISSFHDDSSGSERGANTIFHLMIDGLNILHLGDFGQSKLTEEQLSQIGQTDILLIPVGGKFTVNGKTASEIVAQLEPKIIIPMHYAVEGLKFELDPVENFLKEMGVEGITPVPKLSITRDKLPEEPQVIVLSKT